MRFLRDPVWAFFGSLAALFAIPIALFAIAPFLAGIVFIILLIGFGLLSPKIRPVKTIFFRVVSDTLVLTIKEEQEVQGEIEVLYNKKPIDKDIHLVILRLWNASSDPILVEDFKNSIKMNFGKDALILSGHILESNPPGIKEEIDSNKLIQLDAGSVELKPIWLNEDHSLTMKVLLTKYQGEVITDESRIIVGGFVRDWEKSNYFKFKKVIDRFLEPVNVFLSFFLGIIFIALISTFISG